MNLQGDAFSCLWTKKWGGPLIGASPLDAKLYVDFWNNYLFPQPAHFHSFQIKNLAGRSEEFYPFCQVKKNFFRSDYSLPYFRQK